MLRLEWCLILMMSRQKAEVEESINNIRLSWLFGFLGGLIVVSFVLRGRLMFPIDRLDCSDWNELIS